MSRRDSPGAANAICHRFPRRRAGGTSRCHRLASPSCLEVEPLARDEPLTRDEPAPLVLLVPVRNWQTVHVLPLFLFVLHRCLRHVIRTRCRNGLNPALRQGSRRGLELPRGTGNVNIRTMAQWHNGSTMPERRRGILSGSVRSAAGLQAGAVVADTRITCVCPVGFRTGVMQVWMVLDPVKRGDRPGGSVGAGPGRGRILRPGPLLR